MNIKMYTEIFHNNYNKLSCLRKKRITVTDIRDLHTILNNKHRVGSSLYFFLSLFHILTYVCKFKIIAVLEDLA